MMRRILPVCGAAWLAAGAGAQTAPDSYNVAESGLTAHVFGSGSTASMLVCGDSISSGEPSSANQGWDNAWYGMLRTWSPARVRGISLELSRDAGNYNASPDLFVVKQGVLGTMIKHNGMDNTWLPDGAGGIVPDTGIEWQGRSQQTVSYYECEVVPNRFGASVRDCLTDELTARVIYYRHPNGPAALQVQGQRQGQPLQTTALDDRDGTPGLQAVEIPSGIAAADLDTDGAYVRLGQQSSAGDLSADYTRVADFLVYRSGPGLYMDSISIGGSNAYQWGNSYDSGGFFTDEALRTYMASAMDTDTVFYWIGQNDINGFNRSLFKANVRNAAKRFQAAMVANGVANPRVCLIGTYWSQEAGNPQDAVEQINEVCWEIAQEGVAAGRLWSSISLMSIMGNQRIDPKYIAPGQSIHLNQAGADYVARLLQDAMVCYADRDRSGVLDLFDFLSYVNLFNSGDIAADCNGDGVLDLFDFLCFTNHFNAGC